MKTNTEAIQFMNALVSHMDTGVITFNLEGNITLINSKAMMYFAIVGNPDQLIGSNIINCITDIELLDSINQCIHQSRFDFQFTNLHINDRYLNVSGKKLLDDMLLSISDVTENVLAKDEATQSLLLGQETERRRLAKEIHDGVGPTMSSIKLQVDAVKRKASSQSVINALDEINEAISDIATEIRQISHDLMPNSLIDYGVDTALSNFAKKITQSSDIEVHYQSNIEDGQLTKEYELNIYRVVQELINNALKYSQCKNIEISLREDKGNINLLVQDDGIGMNTNTISTGIGLLNIESRITSLHGNLELNSQIGSGVSILIDIPSDSNELAS